MNSVASAADDARCLEMQGDCLCRRSSPGAVADVGTVLYVAMHVRKQSRNSILERPKNSEEFQY